MQSISSRARLAPHLSAVAAALALASCASSSLRPSGPVAEVAPFSISRPGLAIPRGWQPWVLTRLKARTNYDLIVDAASGRVVLRAMADGAASGLRQPLDVDPATRPYIAWRWKISTLIDGADSTDRDAEDSPARLMLFFDGDKQSLPAREQMRLELARLASGSEPPYATLMYIWENRRPIGTVIPSAHTTRVKMIVAGSGHDRLGQWKEFERDYVQDYRHAFGEPPGRLIGVAILTDTDNTGTRVEALYGDIQLHAQARQPAKALSTVLQAPPASAAMPDSSSR